MTCRAVKTGKGKHHQTVQGCTTRLTSSPVKFTTTDLITAVLSRGKIVYGVGLASRAGNRTKLLLTPLRAIHDGRYTLTLTHGRKRQRGTITI